MKNTSRVTTIPLLAFAVLILAAISGAQSRPPIAEQIAKAYGLDSFGQIEAIRYTWNAQFPGVNISRTWVWEPKTGQVSYEGKDKDGKPVKVTYLRSQLNSQPANVKDEIEPSFVNDQYWLIFPFHVVWDSSPAVEDAGKQKLPLGKGTAEKVVVKYPAEAGGYTPGDTSLMGSLQESRSSPRLHRPPRHGRRQPLASLLFGRSRQADGLRHLGRREIRQQQARLGKLGRSSRIKPVQARFEPFCSSH
jgi:hypothetical protein